MKYLGGIFVVLFAPSVLAMNFEMFIVQLQSAHSRISTMTQNQFEKKVAPAAKVLEKQNKKKAANVLRQLEDPKNRQLFMDRLDWMLAEQSQNGLLVFADYLVNYSQGYIWACETPSQEDYNPWTCAGFLLLAVGTFDSQELPAY